MITRICPAYEGSVKDSGYATIPVLNTTSPDTEVVAPKEKPAKRIGAGASYCARSGQERYICFYLGMQGPNQTLVAFLAPSSRARSP